MYVQYVCMDIRAYIALNVCESMNTRVCMFVCIFSTGFPSTSARCEKLYDFDRPL